MFILCVGSPSEGFYYIGPFESADDASAYAEENIDNYWWISKLESPTD